MRTARSAIRHELARRALEDSLSRPPAQHLHAKVLAVLAAGPVSPRPASLITPRRAQRRRGTALAPLAASQAASVGAHREAASHYQNALRYADVLQPAERARLQEQSVV